MRQRGSAQHIYERDRAALKIGGIAAIASFFLGWGIAISVFGFWLGLSLGWIPALGFAIFLSYVAIRSFTFFALTLVALFGFGIALLAGN